MISETSQFRFLYSVQGHVRGEEGEGVPHLHGVHVPGPTCCLFKVSSSEIEIFEHKVRCKSFSTDQHHGRGLLLAPPCGCGPLPLLVGQGFRDGRGSPLCLLKVLHLKQLRY